MAILGHPPVFIQTLIDILGEIFPHIPTLHMHLKMCEWLISTFPVSLLQSSILSILHFLLGKLCQIMSKHVTSLFWWLTQPISDVKIPLFEITGGTFNTSEVFQPSNGHGRCTSLRKRQLGWGKTNKDPQILLFVRSFFFNVVLLYQL